MTKTLPAKKRPSQNSIDTALVDIVDSFTFQPTTSMWLVTLKSAYRKTEELRRFVNGLFNYGGISKFKYEREENGTLVIHFSTYKHKFERALYPVLRQMMFHSRAKKLAKLTGIPLLRALRNFVAAVQHVKACFLLRARKEAFSLPASISVISASGKFASPIDSPFED